MDEEDKFMWEQVAKENDKIEKQNKDFLEIVKKEKGTRFYKKLLLELGEDTDWYIDGFVETPSGNKQQGDNTNIEYWVNQYCNGGYSGDDYAGYMYFQIQENKFLKVHYQC